MANGSQEANLNSSSKSQRPASTTRNNSSNSHSSNSLLLVDEPESCFNCESMPTARVLTLHGSAHFSNGDNHLAYRITWALIFLFLTIIGAYWSIVTYIHWSSHPTLTTVKTTGLPIAQVDFPSITICGQGFKSLDPILRQQFEEYVRKRDPSYTNGSAATDREWMKKLISDLYPGLDDDADLDTMIIMLLTTDPDRLIRSLVLTHGGYDPCLFGPVNTCPNGWMQVRGGRDSCFNHSGVGGFKADPCPAMGAHLPRLSSLDDVKAIATQGLLQMHGTEYFWLDVFYDVNNNDFKFYGTGQSLSNSSIQLEKGNNTDGKCIKAKLDQKSIVYMRSKCEDPALYICLIELLACNDSRETFNHDVPDEIYEKSVDLLFNPVLQKDLTASVSRAKVNTKKRFRSMDKAKSFDALFELLWSSTLSCYNSEKNSYPAMIRECAWRNVPVPCSAIFNKTPTDRGMCCAFNIQTAEMLTNSVLEQQLVKHQQKDLEGIDADQQVPDWWLKNKLTPRTGRDNGLSFTLDGEWHHTAASAIDENFQGFVAVVDAKNQYPFTRRKKKLYLMPGYENLVSLSAFSVVTDKSAFNYEPEVRQCFFSHEKQLGVHKHYTSANCLLECTINVTLSRLQNKCVPWYLPFANNSVSGICDPWETIQFRQIMDNVSLDDECSHCLSQCFETQYSASLSTAPFRKPCGLTNIGRTTFCDVDFNADRDLSIWGKDVLAKYRHLLPKEAVLDLDDAMAGNRNYDPYVKDIASVYFFFESPTIIEYSRETRLTKLELMGQIGGLMGLCIGMSLISVIELVYWGVYNLVRLCCCYLGNSKDRVLVISKEKD